MIKWPEPAGYIRKDQLQKVQQGWAYLCDVGPEPRADKQPIHTEAQLKHAVRDAYEDVLGIDWFELMRNNFDKERSEHIAESIETAIRALIKEI